MMAVWCVWSLRVGGASEQLLPVAWAAWLAGWTNPGGDHDDASRNPSKGFEGFAATPMQQTTFKS